MQIDRSRKRDRLQTLRERCARITDALGEPIDPGIFETVVFLNAFGFSTTGSCEGHYRRGSPTPWVDIAVAIPSGEQDRAIVTLREANRQQKRHWLPDTEVARLLSEAQHQFRALDCYYQRVLKALMELLTAFYQSYRQSIYDRQLTVRWDRSLAGTVRTLRLESQGAVLVDHTDTAHALLEVYQAEMRAFTSFLTDRYWGNNEGA